jgi:hypothetical protein
MFVEEAPRCSLWEASRTRHRAREAADGPCSTERRWPALVGDRTAAELIGLAGPLPERSPRIGVEAALGVDRPELRREIAEELLEVGGEAGVDEGAVALGEAVAGVVEDSWRLLYTTWPAQARR